MMVLLSGITGSYLTVPQALIHPDRVIHLAEAAADFVQCCFLLTMAIQLFETDQYVSENFF